MAVPVYKYFEYAFIAGEIRHLVAEGRLRGYTGCIMPVRTPEHTVSCVNYLVLVSEKGG
jgi:hypothetical protein